MLFCNPAWLFDVGFQLSFLAVASILLIQKPIYHLITVKGRIGKYIWGSAHKEVLERFYSENREYETIFDAYNAHALVYAIYKSASEGEKYIKLGEK